MSSHKELHKLYMTSSEKVRGKYDDATARCYFKPYIDFLISCCDGRGKLLDVGCGDSSSTSLLAEHGFEATGIDLNKKAFRNKVNCLLVEGSVLILPFENNTFDVVSCYQVIEHIPDPERALKEMIRVLKPNGLLCVVGPNLLSLGQSLKAMLIYVWRNRPISRVFFRAPGMPFHPFGNTLFEAIFSFFYNVKRIIEKSTSKVVVFDMREPDLVPPFHADNDASYVCNPIDLCKYLKANSFRLIRTQKKGRLPFTQLIAGGTWVSARKTNLIN